MRALREVAERTPGGKGMSLKVGPDRGSIGTMSNGRGDGRARDASRPMPEPVRRHTQLRGREKNAQGIALVDKGRTGTNKSRTPIRDGMFAGLVIGSFGKQFEKKRASRPLKKSLRDRVKEARKAFKKFMRNPLAELPKPIADLVKSMAKSGTSTSKWPTRHIGQSLLNSKQRWKTQG